MDERKDDDLATLWSLPTGASCIIRTRGTNWHLRVDQNGVTTRETTVPNSRTAIALAGDWQREFEQAELHRRASAPTK